MNNRKACGICFFGSVITSQLEERNKDKNRIFCTKHWLEVKAGDYCSTFSHKSIKQQQQSEEE